MSNNTYNDQFIDAVDKLNKMADMLVKGNAKKWASKAATIGIIDYEDRARIEQLVNLRNAMGHGGSSYINVGPGEVREINNYSRIMSNTANRLKNSSRNKGGGNGGNRGGNKGGRNGGEINLPDGTFRFVKEFRLEGNDHKTYYFKFRIVEEYQRRAYDDGTRFSGTGYTIYVLEAPYKEWCQARSVFHYYNSPADRPSICWNSLVTDFADANAVMITWAKRYVKLLVSYIQNGELNESSAHHRVKNKGILPTGTFRFFGKSKNCSACPVMSQFEDSSIYIQPSAKDIRYNNACGLVGLSGLYGKSDYIDSFLPISKHQLHKIHDVKFIENILENECKYFSLKGIKFNRSVVLTDDIELAKKLTQKRSLSEVILLYGKSTMGIVVKFNGEISLRRISHMQLPALTFRAPRKKRNGFKPSSKPTVTMTEEVYQQILETIGTLKPEKGGMLGSTDGKIIDSFVFDKNANTGTAEYSPNTKFLNRVLEEEWSDISFKGFVHSHPFNGSELSSADIEYAIKIMRAVSLQELFMPLVNSSAGGKFRIFGFIVKANGKVVPCNIKRVQLDVIQIDDIGESSLSEEEIMKRFDAGFSPIVEETSDSPFARVESVLNIDFLKQCTVIGIGCGGAREFYLDMARIGVENFFLMDGDKVSVQNIASQNVYSDEIGLPKTDVTRTNILRINSTANIVSIPEMLDDSKDDVWFETEILSKCNKNGNILLCAFTDSFIAQARLSRLALKYDLPFISAQHHAKGETSEIIFWYPGVTQYCQKEILKDRYESYENGYKNAVTSEGSPIFNTSRLNSICTKLATGMLLYKDSEFNLYSMFLTMKPNSNLLVIRQNSLLNSDSNLAQLFTADEAGYFFDDIVWVDVDTILEYDNACECRRKIVDTRRLFE